MRFYIINSIIKRDFKEAWRNPQSLIIIGVVLGINTFLSVTMGKSLWIMTFSMSLVMIGFTLTAFMITEEKEKKTLDALLVSPASYSEILIGKVFLTFLITIIITFILIFSFHHQEISILHTFLVVPIGALIICLFGIILGLICQTQAMLSSLGTILMLLLFLPELLAPMNETIGYFARALPTHHVIQIASLGRDGFSFKLIKHYGVLLLSLSMTIIWVASFLKTAAKQEGRKWSYDKSNKVTTFLVLLTLVFSSLIFLPIRGKVIRDHEKNYHYINEQYQISIPYNSKSFELKEFQFQGRFVVRFLLSDPSDSYIYLTIKKNSKNFKHQERLDSFLKEVKEENTINLKTEEIRSKKGIKFNRFEYEAKNGYYLYYIFNTKEFLYKIGAEVPKEKGEDYIFLSKFIENSLDEIFILLN